MLQKHGRKLGREMETGGDTGTGELSGQVKAGLESRRGSGRRPGQGGEAAGWMGRGFSYVWFAFPGIINSGPIWIPRQSGGQRAPRLPAGVR